MAEIRVEEKRRSMGWLWALLIVAALAALAWWWFGMRDHDGVNDTRLEPAPATTAPPPSSMRAAPAPLAYAA